MKARSYGITALIALVAATASFVVARASGVPTTTPLFYSGLLEDQNGPINGSKSIALRIFDDAAAGMQVCNPSPSGSTQVTAGRFRVPLDATCTDAIHANPNLWIEVTVDSQTLPRTKIGAVPYALEADKATTSAQADGLGSSSAKTVTANAEVAPAKPGGVPLGDVTDFWSDVVARHYVAAGGTPTTVVGSDPTLGTNPAVTISGTDASGVISFTAGAGPATFTAQQVTIATIKFSTPYSVAPHAVFIQPADSLSANAQLQPAGRILWYSDSGALSTTQFTINYESESAQNSFSGGRTYKLSYWVM